MLFQKVTSTVFSLFKNTSLKDSLWFVFVTFFVWVIYAGLLAATPLLVYSFSPLVLLVVLAFYPGGNKNFHRILVLGSLFIFVLGLWLASLDDPISSRLVYLNEAVWPFFEYLGRSSVTEQLWNFTSLLSFNLSDLLAVDQLSHVFIVLTNFVMLICYLVSRSMVRENYRAFIYLFVLLHFLLIQFFLAINLLFFYILFEAILVPMFFIIGVWGGRERRTFAAYSFFLFTAFGSLFMLLAIAYLMYLVPSLNYFILLANLPGLAAGVQVVLFLLFFVGFAVKIPMFPVHLWLPEAHVEAPTLGSILLAGVLLKLGGYGMLRFLLPFFPLAIDILLTFLFVVCLVSVLYSAFIGLCQLDMKKIIAYSSITHMNFSVAGLFAGDYLAVQGAIYSMFSHGLIASALFLAVGVLYDRYHSRLLAYYGGLSSVMPFFAGFLFFFVIANVGIPPLSGFIAEMAVLLGVANVNYTVAFLLFTSSVAMTVNFFWFYNRLTCGPVSGHFGRLLDLRTDEFLAFLLLALGVLLLGVKPSILFDYCDLVSAYVRSQPISELHALFPTLKFVLR